VEIAAPIAECDTVEVRRVAHRERIVADRGACAIIRRMTVRIRDAIAADIPRLAPIEASGEALFAAVGHTEFVGAGTISEEYAARAVAERRIRVAELDGQVVGWLLTSRLDGELLLSQLSVEANHGRRGIGTALLVDCIERARVAAEPSLLLDTQADVPWNAPWYARHGFEHVPPERWTGGLEARARAEEAEGFDWATRVFMRLPLRPPDG
jgi:ribosomal protein S18 acetylase RimI-like enzyme